MLYDSGNSNRGSVTTYRDGMGWTVGGRLKREETYISLWLIHVDECQKLTQNCNYPSIKNKFLKIKNKFRNFPEGSVVKTPRN